MSLKTSIMLQDNFSVTLGNITSSVNVANTAMSGLHNTVQKPFDVSPIGDMTNSVDDLQNALNSINNVQPDKKIRDVSRAITDTNNKLNNTRKNIDNNSASQRKFNKELSNGSSGADKLMRKIGGLASAYVGIQAAQKVASLSDTSSTTTARLDLMQQSNPKSVNDELKTTAELQQAIYESSLRSRGNYQDTADAVSKLGLMAGDAFSSSKEIIAFVEQLNKQFVIAGTEASGISSVMLQLTQAMGSGVLRGDEFNSIAEQVPTLLDAVAKYLEVPKGSLKELASQGKITAEVIKNSLFAAAESTNANFDKMPKTFAQQMTYLKNYALQAFQPILQKLSEFANSEQFTKLINVLCSGINILVSVVSYAFDIISSVATFLVDNWSILSPLIMGLVAIMGIFTFALMLNKIETIKNTIATTINNLVKGAANISNGALAKSTIVATGATIAQTGAQWGLNSALLACPITWIILGIISLIAVVFAIANAVAKFTGVASSGFGIICGCINIAIQFFINLFYVACNIALGIGSSINALCHNIRVAFSNAIKNVKAWFYDLLSTALKVIDRICTSLNKLPFISFDFSGITSKALEYENKARELRGSKEDYKSISAEFNKGFNTFDAFGKGWVGKAFNDGVNFGDGIANKVSGFFGGGKGDDGGSVGTAGLPSMSGGIPPAPTPPDIANGMNDIAGGVGNIAGNTGAIKDSIETSQEDLKYLRDIAERDTINKFTTAEIKVDMGGVFNNVSSGTDLDGMISKLASDINDAMSEIAEGVHVA